MTPELTVNLLQLLGAVAMPFLTWAAGRVATYFAAKTQSQQVGTAISSANDAVLTVVAELEQTMVATLKSKSGQGTLTAKDVDEVRAAALDKVMSYLGPNGVALISKALGIPNDKLGDWLQGKIQAAVYSMRPGANPALPAFTQGTVGTVYNQVPGEVQSDGSTSRGLPAFGAMTDTEKKGGK